MKKTLISLAALTVAASAGTAVAQEEDFNKIDTDGDGNLTYEEITAAMPDFEKQAFESADINSDGFVDQDEFLSIYDGAAEKSSTTGDDSMESEED